MNVKCNSTLAVAQARQVRLRFLLELEVTLLAESVPVHKNLNRDLEC